MAQHEGTFRCHRGNTLRCPEVYVPQVFDIKEGPKESYELWGNEGYIHAWVMGPVMEILSDLSASQQQYPNIKPGQDFSGYE
jgi:arylsulfatase